MENYIRLEACVSDYDGSLKRFTVRIDLEKLEVQVTPEDCEGGVQDVPSLEVESFAIEITDEYYQRQQEFQSGIHY